MRFYLLIVFLVLFNFSYSQSADDSFKIESVKENISFLASGELKGRVNFTKEQLIAAEFLSKEFTSYGLQPFTGQINFYIPFRSTWGKKSDGGELFLNGKKIEDSLFIFIQHRLTTAPKTLSDFVVLQAVPPLAENILYNNWEYKQDDILICVQLTEGLSFTEALSHVHLPNGIPASDILIVGVKEMPDELTFTGNRKLLNSELYNIVGMIPGKSLPEEIIIFSAHYDHIDHGIFGEKEGIYYGANDNASGTTAVLALAKYFALRKDNNRTLVFCLFAGEELGLYGSSSFAEMINPAGIKAVINIEMIGITNATGKNAFMVTGSHLSNLAKILRQNLKNDQVKVLDQRTDPNFLFQRSDNFPFAQKGIPAHTIMCSDDNEPCYHKSCDEVKRIDINNMTRVIQAIAKSCSSLISGKDTPTRIKN